MESRPSPRTKPRGNHVSSRGWLPNRVPKQPQLWGAGPGGHGTVRRPRALPVQLTRELNAGLNSRRVKAGLLSVNSCERLEGVGSEAYPHQKATMPGPPKRCPSGGSWHLSESGTDTNRPAKTWVRYRRCRDAVPAGPSREGQAPPVCGSKYRYLVGSRQMVPEAALQVMLIRRPCPSGPSGILTRTPVKPTQPTQARTGIYRAACKGATSA